MVSNNFGEPKGHSSNASAWARARPLSDIRELTEPSLADTNPYKHPNDANPRSTARADSARRPSNSSRRPSLESKRTENREPERKASTDGNGARSVRRGRSSARTPSPTSPSDWSLSSMYNLPHGTVPPRSSSRVRMRTEPRNHAAAQQAPRRVPLPSTLNSVPPIPLPPPRGPTNDIPRRGKSQSPVRHVAERLDPVSHDFNRRVPSRTFIREPLSSELVEFPLHRHPRIQLGLDLSASIFVGGGSIEGMVQVGVDDVERVRHRKTLAIARISIDLLGLEEASGNKRAAFINLATELIDKENPPPHNMVDGPQQLGPEDPFWPLLPSVTHLPFTLSLPLNVGPPPFQSKHAKIRYVLCVSLLVRDQQKQYIVRTSEDVIVLSVYDPEKALVSLPSPLTSSDEWLRPRETGMEVLRVTAGLHRQVWVSGTSIYVDVHIANHSRKAVKRIELQLERDILCYKHAAASTMERSASQARIFDSNEKSILSRAVTRQGSLGWLGVPAHQTHTRTCDLEVPRGHATVKCGKYFEVRYFLNVVVSGPQRLVTVQLPIVLIHMNSLDVVPNSVAQVAAAIEEKRTAHTYQRTHSPPRLDRRPSCSIQGRAFAAPRMQSIERLRAQAEDLRDLGHTLEQSPRKCSLRRIHFNWDYRTPPSNRKGQVLDDGAVADLRDKLRSVRSTETLGGSTATPMHKTNSIKSRMGCGSALGFREAEVREDMELGGFGSSGEAPFKQRLEQSRERQYRFAKKRSVERWRDVANAGVGWLKGGGGHGGYGGHGGGKDERERDGWI